MTASIYGRTIRIKPIQTKSGKPMTVCSLAVTLSISKSQEQHTEWINIVSFGDVAENLAKLEDGVFISAFGRMQINLWTNQEGSEKKSLQLIADNILSAKTSRPGGGRKKKESGNNPTEKLGDFYNDPVEF